MNKHKVKEINKLKKLINALEIRLGTCRIDSFSEVKTQLLKARTELADLKGEQL